MDVMTWILVGLILLISWLLLGSNLLSARQHKLPPGPIGLPLIGSPWLLLQELHIAFTDLSKVWGDIFMVNLLGKKVVVLNTAELVREAFASQAVGDTMSGRPPPPLDSEIPKRTTAFLQASPLLLKQRKLVHKILNMYGDGVQDMENTVQEELKNAVGWLEKRREPVDMDDIIYPSLINIITILLKGRRYEYNSKELKNVTKLDEAAAQGASFFYTILFSFLPFLKYIPIGPGSFNRAVSESTDQFKIDFYDESKATYDPKVTRGMIDFLIHHQEETKFGDGSGWLEDKSVEAIIQEMVGAGSITTRGALYSFFLIIAHHADVAKLIQDEIETVVGSDRFPRLEDKSRMPYTAACVFELLRYISHLPTALPHLTMVDVTFKDYFIPANTTIMGNFWKIHHDEKLWDDPWMFKPRRFLDSEGQILPADHPNRKNLMPFGIGRRSCVGEVFARSRMFLFISTLLQRFDFGPDPSRPLPSCDPRTYRPGLVKSSYRYFLRVTART